MNIDKSKKVNKSINELKKSNVLNENELNMHSTPLTPTWHRDFLENKISLQQELNHKDLAFKIPSPSYVLCYDSLDSNLTLLENVSKECGADILVALKGYSFWRTFEPVYTKLHGATCSGLHEARLAFDTIAIPCLSLGLNLSLDLDYSLQNLQNTQDSKNNIEKQDVQNTHNPKNNKNNKMQNSTKKQHSKTLAQNIALTLLSRLNQKNSVNLDKDLMIENFTTKDSLDFKDSLESIATNPIAKDIEFFQDLESNTDKILVQDIWQRISKHIPYAFFHPFTQKEICVFAPAYKESSFREILHYATHIIFNSLGQWERLKPHIDRANARLRECYEILTSCQKDAAKIFKEIPQIKVGLRVNPLYSEVEPPIYNPCIPKSRLGIIPSVFHKEMENLANKYGFADKFLFFEANFSGLHFHTHCEQDSSALGRTLPHVIEHFGDYISHCKWINFGGGHHITRSDYNCAFLLEIIRDFRAKYNGIKVILEPGEAVGWQTGDLIGEVLDIVENDGLVAILDVSASCHMPDCLEMPYRPSCYKISKDSKGRAIIENDLGVSESEFKEGVYKYRFGGPTCLAGDVIGDYSFASPLKIGDRVAFTDMIHYTIVKNTTFNGVELPSLGVVKDGSFRLLKQFDYLHFKERN